MSQQASLLETARGRQRAVTAILNFTRDTALAPSDYELELLTQFVAGHLSLDQVLNCLDHPQECLCA